MLFFAKIFRKIKHLSFFWQKFFSILEIAIIFIVLYTSVSFLYIGKSYKLPVTIVDRSVPFLPWTFWIYVSDYFFLAIIALMTKTHDELNDLRNAFISLMLFHVSFFFVFSTSSYRVHVTGSSLSEQVAKLVYMLDSPRNCFPSLHVSLSYLGAFAVINIKPKYFLPFFIWASAIAMSTLTTKQHYFYDVVGGFLTSSFVYITFYYITPYIFKTEKNNKN